MNKRFEYMDALRGMAILFIVFGHIPMYCYGAKAEQLSSFRVFTSMVQIPLFFFISGFVFNIRLFSDSSNRWVKLHYTLSKVKQLLLPTIVFGGIYIAMNDISPLVFLTDGFKSGYWFTWSLFEFLMMQLLIEYAANHFNLKENGTKYLAVCVGITLLMYIISLPTICERMEEYLSGLLGLSLLRYYLYFTVGRLVRIHLRPICAWKCRDTAVALIAVVFISLAVITWDNDCNFSGIFFHINLVVFELSALLLFFAVFYRHRNYFTRDSKSTRILTFVGRRTLDIYLLHYFFLPKDLHLFGSYFISHPAPIIEFIFSFLITVAIVVVCLFVSELLRSSKLITQWTLGGK